MGNTNGEKKVRSKKGTTAGRRGMDEVADSTGNAILDCRLEQLYSKTVQRWNELPEERAIKQLERLVKEATNDEYVLLIYDIESVKDSECPNPSPILWHFGFRLNKSGWVMPRSSFNASVIKELMAHWAEHNIEVHVVRQHPEEQANLRRKARIMLEKRIIATHTSLITRLDSASNNLEQAQKELDERVKAGEDVSWQEVESPEKQRDTHIRVILRESTEALMGALDCARLFDETENVKDLLEGLRQAIISETKTFNARMLQNGRKPAPLVPRW